MEIRYYGDKLSERIAKTPEGFLICQDVPISRTGYQEYLAKELMDDPINGNKIIPVYRPAKEVFDIRSLASFEGKPVTNEHPDEDVTPENYQQYSCGHVQNVHVGDGEDSNKVLADLYITDPTLIHLIENGKREVSCGYYAEEEKDSSGRLYQTKIRGNHVAVVRSGRAGNKVCIRDSNPVRDDSHIETLSDYIEGLRYIKDEGKKGMKKGQHVAAKDPDYLKTIATGAGVGTAVGATAGAALPVAGGAAIGHYYNKHAPEKYKKYLTTGKGAAHGLKLAPFGAIGGGWKGLKVGALAGLGAAGIQALRHRYKNRGDSDYSNYLTEDEAMEDNEILYDDDEILEDDDELMYDDDEILEDDDELMYDDDEILEDDDELFIRDEGKKGMKKGQHVMAKDPDYLAALKGGAVGAGAAAAGYGAYKAGGKKLLNKINNKPNVSANGFETIGPEAKPTYTQRAKNWFSGKINGSRLNNPNVSSNGFETIGPEAKQTRLTKVKNFIGKHPKAMKRGALGLGLAAAGGIGAAIGARRNRGDSWYRDDDELMYDDDEILLDDDMILGDDEEILEDGCRYEDEDEILEDDDELMYDDDEILEDDDEMILEDDDELMYDDDEILEDDDEILEDDDDVIESAKSIISDARYTLNKIKKNLRKARRRYDSEIITEDDDEILEDDDEILEDDDEILEDDDEAILEDDDEEILEDDDEMILEDDDEIFEDDDEMVLEDDDEAILEDDDEILEDDDEMIIEDDDEDILEDDDEEILEDDDEAILEDDDEEILEDDDEEVVEDEAPESEVIDTDKTAALREITEASRGITDPNERKQIQDAIYSALCGKKNQMADVMRITKKARKARMDAAFDSSSKVSLDKQQSIYDSFNPHKKTSF